jgi:hypothetical protein
LEGNEQGTEGAGLESQRSAGLLGLLDAFCDGVHGAEVDLRDDLGFAADALDLADVVVGSSFFDFLV